MFHVHDSGNTRISQQDSCQETDVVTMSENFKIHAVSPDEPLEAISAASYQDFSNHREHTSDTLDARATDEIEISNTYFGNDNVKILSGSYDKSDSEASALAFIYDVRPRWKTDPGPVSVLRFTDGIMNTVRTSSSSPH